MKKAQIVLRYDDYGIIPPCMTMEKIMYSYKEIELLNTKWKNNGNFWITIAIRNPKFKEIPKTKDDTKKKEEIDKAKKKDEEEKKKKANSLSNDTSIFDINGNFTEKEVLNFTVW